jgi:membrane fusion protein (multidrug efflux system)
MPAFAHGTMAGKLMKKTVLGVLVALGVAAAAFGGFWFGLQRPEIGAALTPQSAPGAAQPAGKGAAGGPGGGPGAAVTVEVARPVTAAMAQTITAVGSLRSDESVTLRPEVAGRVSAIQFQEGQRVAKGAPLIKLDASINLADVQQARANLTLARSKFDRATDLARSNFISGQAKDEAENNLKVAEAAVALSEAKLAKTEIMAPFAGIIGLRVVSVGDYVKEGADMVNLEAVDPLKVDFRVPEVYLRQVEVGQALQVSLDAIPGKFYDGKVIAVNPLVDAAGRAVVIRAQVRNQDTALRPGMFARVRLITRDQKDALVVPEQALVPQGDEQYVFRVIDGKAVRTKIDVGQRRDGKVEVVAGLAAGDMVVSAGQLKLRDGTVVTVVGNGAPAVAGGTGGGAASSPEKGDPARPPKS